MGTPTYQPIANITLSSNAPSVTFSGITQSYRDLVLIINGKQTAAENLTVRFNSDFGSNYPLIRMFGYSGGTGTSTATETSLYVGGLNTSTQTNIIINIMDYSATDKHKTCLVTQDIGGDTAMRMADRWANNAGVSTISCTTSSGNIASGSTFALYGILA